MSRKRILILCPNSIGRAPGQRFRFEQYIPALLASGHEVTIAPFLSESAYSFMYKKGYFARKAAAVAAGFLRRAVLILSAARFDRIFIFREASPLGPPVFEFILCAMGKTVIYDFDDAIYLARASAANQMTLWLKCPWKVGYICRKANIVSVCNPHLVSWVRQHTNKTLLLPTTIDLGYHKPISKASIFSRRVVIGWTGSHSTVRYLALVEEALIALSKRYDFEFVVICDVDPKLTSIKNYRFIPWRLETEIADLGCIDIGLMPVPDGEWELGKVGFKAIQYSGIAAVPIVSSTGSGHEVVIHGQTGFVVANSTNAWSAAIEYLLDNPDEISIKGTAAREFIDTTYSVRANTPKFTSLFE